MPSIQLTDNTSLNVTASTADGNATLNRYLTNPLSFITPAALNAIAGEKVGDLDPTAFPIAASAAGEGQFAVEGTCLDVQTGASASVGLLAGANATVAAFVIPKLKSLTVALSPALSVPCNPNETMSAAVGSWVH